MTPYANEFIGEYYVALGGIDQLSTTYLAFGKYLKITIQKGRMSAIYRF